MFQEMLFQDKLFQYKLSRHSTGVERVIDFVLVFGLQGISTDNWGRSIFCLRNVISPSFKKEKTFFYVILSLDLLTEENPWMDSVVKFFHNGITLCLNHLFQECIRLWNKCTGDRDVITPLFVQHWDQKTLCSYSTQIRCL